MSKIVVIKRVRYKIVSQSFGNLYDENEEVKEEGLCTIIAISKGILYRLTRKERFGGWIFGRPFNTCSDWTVEELCEVSEILEVI